jgi:hypothetical protein
MRILQRRLLLLAAAICALTTVGSAATTPKVAFTDTKLENGQAQIQAAAKKF